MDAQHTNLSSSLPTRRSLRTAASVPTPADAPHGDSHTDAVQVPLTRRQLRERSLNSASTSHANPAIEIQANEKLTAEHVTPAPATRAQLRRARQDEQIQFVVPQVEIEPDSTGGSAQGTVNLELEADGVQALVADEDLDVAAVLARVKAKLPERFLEIDEPNSTAEVSEIHFQEEHADATYVPAAHSVSAINSVSDFADRFEDYARSHSAHVANASAPHVEPEDISGPLNDDTAVLDSAKAEASAVVERIPSETTAVHASLADTHTALRAPAVRMGALGRATKPAVTHENANASLGSARPHPRRNQWVPRLAVLGTLGLATIAFPTISYLDDQQAAVAQVAPGVVAANIGPSVVEIVNASTVSNDVPSSIAQLVSEDARAYLVASRSEERVPLEGCEATGLVYGTNGKIDTSKLCQIAKGHYLQPDAANAYAELSDAFEARFGEKLCVVSSYRTMTDQYRMKATRGSYAAPPGYSNHGWGTAIDLCGGSYKSNAKWYWLNENAPSYGWEHPSWASRSYEAWHWEYAPGVDELAEF